MGIQSKSRNLKSLKAGDAVFIEEKEAVYLGSWSGMCWFSFKHDDENEVQFLSRGTFRKSIT